MAARSQVFEGDVGDVLALAVLEEVRVAVGHDLCEEDIGVLGGGQVWVVSTERLTKIADLPTRGGWWPDHHPPMRTWPK